MTQEEESKPAAETATTEQPGIGWLTPEDIQDVYADWYQMNWMAHTVRIRFAQLIPDPSKPPALTKWVLAERVAVTMPYEAAKALRETLDRVIQAYEKENGVITAGKIPTVVW